MKTRYDIIKGIFVQSSVTDALMEQKVKALAKGTIVNGELRYWFWRYVFMKDLTKKVLTNQLLKAGFDNLTVVEIVDALNGTREIVKEMLDDARERAK
jgi:hypothetical protein